MPATKFQHPSEVDLEGLLGLLGTEEAPLGFCYTKTKPDDAVCPPSSGWACMVALLGKARWGQTVYFDADHHGCGGAGRFMGFTSGPRPAEEMAHFLSTGIPGKLEGERYKKTPELALAFYEGSQPRPAPAPYLVFKRLDRFGPEETPEVVVWFAEPDLISALVVLAQFPREEEDAVLVRFTSGCGSIISLPLAEAERTPPRAVLGMFDVSARPFVAQDELTLATPYTMFLEMIENAPESFLITNSWKKVKARGTG